MSLESIKVSVETISKSGERSLSEFDMDPRRFVMDQHREVRPVYGYRHEDFGRPTHMEVDPDRKGTSLSINGFIVTKETL